MSDRKAFQTLQLEKLELLEETQGMSGYYTCVQWASCQWGFKKTLL